MPDVLALCSPPEQPRSTSPPAERTDLPFLGCSPGSCPSIRSQACQGWRTGTWRKSCTSAALLTPDTPGLLGWSLNCSFSHPEETCTTQVGQGWCGRPAEASKPSEVGCWCCPAASPAGARTRNRRLQAPQRRSTKGGTVHSSCPPPAPASPGSGRLAEALEAAEAPCWRRLELQGKECGLGCRTATALFWLLCTLRCELFGSETTP